MALGELRSTLELEELELDELQPSYLLELPAPTSYSLPPPQGRLLQPCNPLSLVFGPILALHLKP